MCFHTDSSRMERPPVFQPSLTLSTLTETFQTDYSQYQETSPPLQDGQENVS